MEQWEGQRYASAWTARDMSQVTAFARTKQWAWSGLVQTSSDWFDDRWLLNFAEN